MDGRRDHAEVLGHDRERPELALDRAEELAPGPRASWPARPSGCARAIAQPATKPRKWSIGHVDELEGYGGSARSTSGSLSAVRGPAVERVAPELAVRLK